MTTRLAVLGSPIAHSKSPALHRAAYGVLGLDWEYDAIEVAGGELPAFAAGLGAEWRGLSLTMPLKRDVLPLLRTTSPMAERVGAANTVLVRDGGFDGFNTDVVGIIAAFAEAGVDHLESVQILGGGATAASVLVAVQELGATRALVSVRDPLKAESLQAVAGGLDLAIRPLGMLDRSLIVPDAVISTLPGRTVVEVPYPEAVRRGAVLFDVAYEPWPSALATSWREVGGTVVSGLSMLLHQAVAQVRIFVTGAENGELDREDDVIAAMRAAAGL
jgi:shikimate dehydrogenase